MNEQTLEMQIKTHSQEAQSSIQQLVKSLTNVENLLTNIYLDLGNIEKKSNFGTLKDSSDKAKKSVEGLKKTLNLSGTLYAVKRISKSVFNSLQESIDYSENLNLFNVAMADLKNEGIKFQNTLNEVFGTNQSKSLYYQGIFQAMSKSMGIANKYAGILSEGLIKVGYDLASLYNISDESAMKKLRAGLAGQTEPLRTVGMDVTENSLKPLIAKLKLTDSEGELKTPRQLNYAEKMILRYLSIIDQAKVAQGDFANTIEAPANQLKILGMQAAEAKRALGNLFVGAFAKMLPYANAIVMVIKELAKALASFFGIEISDYNSGVAEIEDGFSGIGDSVDDANDGLDDSIKKAKELKRQTLGFDQINNISEDTGSKNDSGDDSILSGGIDKRLLDAIKSYDNGMDKVRMKATEIRDKIMEWLGFQKEIDPVTGAVVWKLKKGLTNLKLIGGLITAMVGLKIISKLGKLKDSISIINSQTGKTKTGFDKLKTAMNKLLIGTVGLVASYKIIQSSTKNLVTQTNEWYKSLLSLSLGFGGAVASGALMGSIFGPMGTGIGAVTGAFVGLIGVIDGYHKGLESLAKSNIYGELTLTAEQLNEITSGIGNNFERENSIINNYKDSIAKLEDTWKTSITTVEQYGLMYYATKNF